MAGGYFPLYRSDQEAKKLEKASQLLAEVIDSLWDEICCGGDGQFDNAADDGGYLRQLSIAKELIEECYEKESAHNK